MLKRSLKVDMFGTLCARSIEFWKCQLVCFKLESRTFHMSAVGETFAVDLLEAGGELLT